MKKKTNRSNQEEEPPLVTQEEFRRHLERTSKIVETWPEWKQKLLGGEAVSNKCCGNCKYSMPPKTPTEAINLMNNMFAGIQKTSLDRWYNLTSGAMLSLNLVIDKIINYGYNDLKMDEFLTVPKRIVLRD